MAGLPVVTASRVDTTTLSSRDIDAAVRDAVLSGRALYAVDEELIRELRPDVVITQDLCHVCAVSGDDVGRIRSLDAEVISLDPRTVADVEATVIQLGERLDASDAARAVVDRMRRTIAAAAEAVAGRASRAGVRGGVARPTVRSRALGARDGGARRRP